MCLEFHTGDDLGFNAMRCDPPQRRIGPDMRTVILVLAIGISVSLGVGLYATLGDRSDHMISDPGAGQSATRPASNSTADDATADPLHSLLERARDDNAGTSEETLEAMAVEAEAYITELQAELEYVNAFNVRDHDASITQISQALTQFGNWSVMVEIGANRHLSGNQEAVRQDFSEALGRAQSAAFPHLRSSYGRHFASTGGLAGLETSTFGRGNGIVQFRNRLFRDERDLQNFHSHRRAMLVHLRFAQARYRWNETGDNFLSYDLDTPADNAVVMWTDIIDHRPVR
jgi:hypothetical protein